MITMNVLFFLNYFFYFCFHNLKIRNYGQNQPQCKPRYKCVSEGKVRVKYVAKGYIF